jgi:hypothetical protein
MLIITSSHLIIACQAILLSDNLAQHYKSRHCKKGSSGKPRLKSRKGKRMKEMGIDLASFIEISALLRAPKIAPLLIWVDHLKEGLVQLH